MVTTKNRKAKKVRVGDFLAGLGDGYVFAVEGDEYDVSIVFHDNDGGENTLTIGRNVPVLVKR